MTRPRTTLRLVDALYLPDDLEAVRAVLRRWPYLAGLVCRAAPALERFFPDAPLRLCPDGEDLVVLVGVPDVEAALLGPLADFDRTWWRAILPRTRGHLSIDVEAADAGF